MSHPTRSIHAQAGLHRKLVLFGTQLELYLAHFPSHHKYVMAQQLRQGLAISHHSLQPLRRGLNWVGYRTWARARFVRPHLISAIRADARTGRLQALVSRLGHARRTSSHRPLITHLTEHHHALVARLPQAHHLAQHV